MVLLLSLFSQETWSALRSCNLSTLLWANTALVFCMFHIIQSEVKRKSDCDFRTTSHNEHFDHYELSSDPLHFSWKMLASWLNEKNLLLSGINIRFIVIQKWICCHSLTQATLSRSKMTSDTSWRKVVCHNIARMIGVFSSKA